MKFVKAIAQPVNSGTTSWKLNEFDAFSSINLSKVLFVVPVLAYSSIDSDRVRIQWDTTSGKCNLTFYSPVSQTVTFNCAVWYAG